MDKYSSKRKKMKKYSYVFLLVAILLIGCEPTKDGPTSITVKDSDGNVYPTVKIGPQIWMAKNMNLDVPGSYCYNNDERNCETRGRLYTWEQAQNVCPEGWHLPSKEEFEILLNYLEVYIEKRIAEKKLQGIPLADIEKEDKPSSESLKSYYLRSKDWGDGLDELGFNAINSGHRDDGSGHALFVKKDLDFYTPLNEPNFSLWVASSNKERNIFEMKQRHHNNFSIRIADFAYVVYVTSVWLKNNPHPTGLDWEYALSIRCIRDKKVE